MPKKKLDQYAKAFNEKAQFFTHNNPDIIEEAVLNFLQEEFKCDP